MKFKKFADSLDFPIAPERTELDLTDWAKIGRPELLHVTLNALFNF
jgi:ubiquitin-activating enzyme E1